ncbi:hypothetical protein [Burkholderia stagnalis]|uniref:hypothetical protein n=1 Tax=Burkholderia stagnalis TaxID=1503054 RepID=UPI00075996C0|nr:hypothetical protein [Burkholderia stagnalis]KVM99827.1 hypothetical protein WT07_21040 [Burkholderia stagnalis]KWE01985.1 hypothetical protein WT47_22090 [Burkholderia stagnalis]KWE13915.1 hypothetical protein WT48_19685 [Burkholderia stagnalis]KWO82089.1 hypothetical protein WU00_33120 [Burkholderia stagnalis]
MTRGPGWIGAALRSLLTGGRQAQSGPVAIADAPEAWVVYAQRVSQRLEAALDGRGAAASRFRAHLECDAGSAANDGASPPALLVRAWLDRRGDIERIESEPAFAPDVATDLRSALVGQPIGAPPPRGMMQPVVVRVGVASEA